MLKTIYHRDQSSIYDSQFIKLWLFLSLEDLAQDNVKFYAQERNEITNRNKSHLGV